MSLKDDIEKEVKSIFGERWAKRNGRVVPSPEDLKLCNDAVKLDGVVLYADMSESTALVDSRKDFFAAEIYKAYLHCAAKIIRSEGGVITAYDGDRIMAVFVGEAKNTSAARAALKVNYARLNIINPAIRSQYQAETYEVRHTIGIDSSVLFVARTGIRGSNDLVWVGRAANHAAKLCDLPNTYPTRVTAEVYRRVHNSAKHTNGKSMWEEVTWSGMNRAIYRSNWWWPLA
jgi:class 3 adenylate cyclase